MARPAATIHVAYSVGGPMATTTGPRPRLDEGFKGYNTGRTGVGDTPAEAMDGPSATYRGVAAMYRRRRPHSPVRARGLPISRASTFLRRH
jgi:hypothetical protein